MSVRTKNLWLTPEMTRAMHSVATTPVERDLMSRFWLRGMSQREYDELPVNARAMIAGLMVKTVARLSEEVNG